MISMMLDSSQFVLPLSVYSIIIMLYSIVCHAGELCQLMGLPTVEHSLVAAVESLMTDSQWRVRLEVVNQIPRLAKQFVRL